MIDEGLPKEAVNRVIRMVDRNEYKRRQSPPGVKITPKAFGKDRREVMTKMSRALGEYLITGIKNTIPYAQAILQDPNFRRGVYSTTFVEQLLSGARRELIEDKA